MENAFLVSLSHQMAARRSMEVIANNLANVSTPAFKRETVRFEEHLSPVENEATGQTEMLAFVLDRGVVRDLVEGRFESTSAPFDFAISGSAFFAVNTDEGEKYTRNGHFMLDDQGRLVTGDGDPVMGDGGEIAITPQDGEIRVASDGTITGEQGQLAKLRLVAFANERALKKAGGGLYTAEGEQPIAAEGAKVRQGFIEKSNVEPVIEIAHMIEVLRAYQASADLTQTGEDLMRRAIQKLGEFQA